MKVVYILPINTLDVLVVAMLDYFFVINRKENKICIFKSLKVKD